MWEYPCVLCTAVAEKGKSLYNGKSKIGRDGVDTMKNSRFVWKDQKKLRTGYTTGSCAAAAAKAAARMLFSGSEVRQVSLMTPAGICLYLDIERIEIRKGWVRCAVKKDSGDDPDVTNGVYVYASVERNDSGDIRLDGGEGVGRVTRKGLEQKVGEAAINQAPRSMICYAVREEMEKAGYAGGVDIVISIPGGDVLAQKTFNPRLGIVGGLSVLGTSGIVEPMSERALTDTIYLEMKMRKEEGCGCCYLVPGNYGEDFLRENIGYKGEQAVKCSNYIGEAIDYALRLSMEGILLVGHAGKLVKVAAGIMNTHSRQADGRMEVLAAHAAMAGVRKDTVKRIMDAVTTLEAIEILEEEGVLGQVMRTVMERIEYHLRQRAGNGLEIAAVVFTKEKGILGKTSEADDLISRIQEMGR